MAKCVIYTRFSPRPDAAISLSCEIQQAHCESLAFKKGYEIKRVISDPDASGADEYRPKLWEAIKLLQKGEILLVYRRDRLARNLYLSETINRAVAKKGATIEAVTGDIEGDGPEQQLVRQVVAAMAEYERKIISAKTRDALRCRLSQHRRVGGLLPYGWKRDPSDEHKLIPDDNEMPTLREIAKLHGEGISNNAIAHRLDPAKSRSGKWHTGAVRLIVKRLTYMPLPD